MKKVLVIILGLFLTTPSWANVITVQAFSNDSTVTHMENFRSTVVTVVNGNIAGSSGGTSSVNILADSIGEIDMADDANPRLRDSELFNITTDTISGGAISSQATVVESGCVQATDTDLTADVSACVCYINGYRVSKAATAQTYANNTVTYLWLSQTGNYTQSTNPNTTVANSSLLSAVTTSGGQITAVSNLFTSRVPGLILPVQYRNGLLVSRDSATTVTVLPGSAEINGSMLSKTTTTTLTLTVNGDWAGGSSLRAANTMGFVGIDTSGNLKLHTTAPTHDNFAVSTTAGKKRYATWSATVYRVLGWFWMNAAQNIDYASNIKEGDVANSIISADGSSYVQTGTGGNVVGQVSFYSSGGNTIIQGKVSGDAGAAIYWSTDLADTTTQLSGSNMKFHTEGADSDSGSTDAMDVGPSQGTHTYRQRVAQTATGNNFTVKGRTLIVEET